MLDILSRLIAECNALRTEMGKERLYVKDTKDGELVLYEINNNAHVTRCQLDTFNYEGTHYLIFNFRKRLSFINNIKFKFDDTNNTVRIDIICPEQIELIKPSKPNDLLKAEYTFHGTLYHVSFTFRTDQHYTNLGTIIHFLWDVFPYEKHPFL